MQWRNDPVCDRFDTMEQNRPLNIPRRAIVGWFEVAAIELKLRWYREIILIKG
jgi:hypothetical protein